MGFSVIPFSKDLVQKNSSEAEYITVSYKVLGIKYRFLMSVSINQHLF
jgi:hypothetical protein